MRSVTLLFGAVSVALFGASSVSAAGDEPAQRFLTDAPVAWKKLDEFTHGLQATLTSTFGAQGAKPDAIINEGKQFSTTEMRFALCNSNGSVFSHQLSSGTLSERMIVQNADYAFHLQRKESSGPWVIAELDPDRTSNRLPKWLGPLFVSTRANDVPVVAIVGSREFKLRSVKSEGALTTVSFVCNYNEDPHNVITGGEFTFNPDSYWRLERYSMDVISGAKGVEQGTVSYTIGDVGFPMPAKFVKNSSYPPANFWRMVSVYHDVRPCQEPESSFNISAFGFAEPDLSAKGWRRFGFIAFNVLALVCFAIAIYFRRRARAARS